VRQDGGAGGPFYGAQPLQPTQTRAPTGGCLQKISLAIPVQRGTMALVMEVVRTGTQL